MLARYRSIRIAPKDMRNSDTRYANERFKHSNANQKARFLRLSNADHATLFFDFLLKPPVLVES